ncbi:MAG TPA: 3-hydroxybutyrate oligomer hydrolase family protein [Pseudolabrys sp.]|nr:3-hydroxybutyrate oligomer hydrolase family protein [Pseudolabrys sp.]
MSRMISSAALLLLFVPLPAGAAVTCADVLKAFGPSLADVNCFASTDLTTANLQTTPADNANPPGLPGGAFTPSTDRTVIAPSAGKRTPITKAVPGLQLNARIASDPQSQARFLLRLPNNWNGRLVVAGASGTRSEFNGDFAWSDYVVQKGYAYASQNKGVLNLFVTTAADPLGCRLNPTTPFFVHFYDNDPGQPFTRWAEYMVKAAELARTGVKAGYGRWPAFTYAVGTSNGGYQVRRAVELAPKLFDGGVDWEGTFVDEHAPNILTDLPPAILNFPDYMNSGFSAASTASLNIQAAGYPPDIVFNGASLWSRYNAQFWEVTQCQWQKRLDPSYDTYVSGTGTYNYVNRLSVSDVGAQLAAFATTGDIQRPLITVAGTMDSLLPINHHARAYARNVAAIAALNKGNQGNGGGNLPPAYRLYEVQNGNHIETYQDTAPAFPQLELIEPHAQRAFDLLVGQVEGGAPLPPDQCIPRGGQISATPAQPGHCANLFAP